MSATFPQVAFWVIFPLAAFIVISGWALTIFVAIKRLRAGNASEKRHPSPSVPQEACDVINTTTEDGVHFSPLL
ncbi:MAG: hypothetical protein FJZ87_17895 [Chloroflexi bacterium]|nr:hypothetical protein [Chloroflexota bacterium]